MVDVRHGMAVSCLAALTLHVASADAQLASCAGIAEDAKRLACYDALAAKVGPEAAPAASPGPNAAPSDARAAPFAPLSTSAASELEQRWELRPELRRGTFRLLPYRPLYALVHATDDINSNPSSPTRSLGLQDVHLDRVEAKLQLSLKTKLAENLLGSATDLWFGYTQQSYWQAANSRYSSPFRETDYQPEAILVHPLQVSAGGVHLRYVSAALTHESNGRGEALSRSWNRVIGDVALESGAWSVHLRPWVRIAEPPDHRDDNPDIEDFVGRGEMILAYRAGGHVVTFTGRHTLRGGDRSRGSGRLDWAFPLTGNLAGHLQLFSGYGESLIDYNHRQTAIGLGVSFFD